MNGRGDRNDRKLEVANFVFCFVSSVDKTARKENVTWSFFMTSLDCAWDVGDFRLHLDLTHDISE